MRVSGQLTRLRSALLVAVFMLAASGGGGDHRRRVVHVHAHQHDAARGDDGADESEDPIDGGARLQRTLIRRSASGCGSADATINTQPTRRAAVRRPSTGSGHVQIARRQCGF